MHAEKVDVAADDLERAGDALVDADNGALRETLMDADVEVLAALEADDDAERQSVGVPDVDPVVDPVLEREEHEVGVAHVVGDADTQLEMLAERQPDAETEGDVLVLDDKQSVGVEDCVVLVETLADTERDPPDVRLVVGVAVPQPLRELVAEVHALPLGDGDSVMTPETEEVVVGHGDVERVRVGDADTENETVPVYEIFGDFVAAPDTLETNEFVPPARDGVNDVVDESEVVNELVTEGDEDRAEEIDASVDCDVDGE